MNPILNERWSTDEKGKVWVERSDFGDEPILDPWNRPMNMAQVQPIRTSDEDNEVTHWLYHTLSPDGQPVTLIIFND
jgi:hypothetical protein